MRGKDKSALREGYTTGACATAAAAAACRALLTGDRPGRVRIRLPGGRTAAFAVEELEIDGGRCRAAVRKDAGDDPDVTHQALIAVTIRVLPAGQGIVIRAGEGVGTVTRPGLPVAVGEPAVNPVPRRMIHEAVSGAAAEQGAAADFEVEISVPGGAELAEKTWNPRLGIVGGISILGTTGIVKPYSCAAWISSIHRGIDVARAGRAEHVIASTGSQSEAAAQRFYGLPDWAMLDMGDFVGGMLKYLRRRPLPYLTVAGGFGKLSKLAQGAMDLHSARSRVDFAMLGRMAGALAGSDDAGRQVEGANTAMQALEIGGAGLAHAVAKKAAGVVESKLRDAPVHIEVMVFSRTGVMAARFSRIRFPDGGAQ